MKCAWCKKPTKCLLCYNNVIFFEWVEHELHIFSLLLFISWSKFLEGSNSYVDFLILSFLKVSFFASSKRNLLIWEKTIFSKNRSFSFLLFSFFPLSSPVRKSQINDFLNDLLVPRIFCLPSVIAQNYKSLITMHGSITWENL